MWTILSISLLGFIAWVYCLGLLLGFIAWVASGQNCPPSLRKKLGDRLAFAASHAEGAFGWGVDDLVMLDAEGVADGGIEVGG